MFTSSFLSSILSWYYTSMKIRLSILISSIIAALLLCALSFSYSNYWKSIRYSETTNRISFVLPRDVRPIGDLKTTFSEFQQFTVPTYVTEGSEMIPYLQVSTSENASYFTAEPKTHLSLDEYYFANVVKQFGDNPVVNRRTVDGHEQLRVCTSKGQRLCNAIFVSADGSKVISFILGYPLQGPRSTVRDTILEKAYLEMINTVTFQ